MKSSKILFLFVFFIFCNSEIFSEISLNEIPDSVKSRVERMLDRLDSDSLGAADFFVRARSSVNNANPPDDLDSTKIIECRNRWDACFEKAEDAIESDMPLLDVECYILPLTECSYMFAFAKQYHAGRLNRGKYKVTSKSLTDS